ncbi:3-deoxy-manno-octulosonate cytidylyltransferase [Alphaproteobacteria bacterium]|nr:3-deoxy-manno-octulosonate cytidylyltransferase [Alphaproteobacteria bacterium]
MVKALIIIPARMSSSRLPGKPLISIKGKTIIERVWHLAKKSHIEDVYVACCDKEIENLLIEKNIPYVYTRKNLKSGTDRVYEAFLKINNRHNYDLIINLQGDIPFFNATHLNKLYELFKFNNYQMATLACPIKDLNKIDDTNIVKVVLAKYKKNVYKALYFSRLPIPQGSKKYYEHIGVYAYTPKILKSFISMKSSKLENSERLEQLRALENFVDIYVALVNNPPISIDTGTDLLKLRKRLSVKE